MAEPHDVDTVVGHENATGRGWQRAVLVLALAVIALLVALLVSGLSLSNSYRPNQAEETALQVHRIAAWFLYWTTAVLVLTAIGGAVSVRLRAASTLPALALGALVLIAAVTGYLLPWDQVALFAVTMGDHLEGVWFVAFDDRVRFVLVGGAEVSPSTYRLWLLGHVIASVAALGVVAVVLRQAARRTEP